MCAGLSERTARLQHQIDLVLAHVEATDLAPQDHDKIRRHSTALADRWLPTDEDRTAVGDGTPPA